jgi:hypothetical protein
MSNEVLDSLVDEAAPATGLHHAINRLQSTLWKDDIDSFIHADTIHIVYTPGV